MPRSIALAIVLAALCYVLFPSAALAADVASMMPVTCTEDEASGSLPPEPICEVVTVEDDDGFFAAAPICDPSGASAVAPQPISPIGDDKIEQTPGCDDGAAALQLGPRPQNDDSPHHQLPTSAEPALVPDAPIAPSWSGPVSELPPSPLLGPSDGVRRPIDHPPHAA